MGSTTPESTPYQNVFALGIPSALRGMETIAPSGKFWRAMPNASAKQLSSAHTSMTPLIAAGVFYYVFNYLVAFAMERLERRFAYYN